MSTPDPTPNPAPGTPPPATEEDKRAWEVWKLRHEVGELRSVVRRSVGGLGGLCAVLATGLSIMVTLQERTTARQETAAQEKKNQADLAEVRMEKAEIKEEKARKGWEDAVTETDKAKGDAAAAKVNMEKALALEEEAKTRIKNADEKADEATARASAAAEKAATEEKRADDLGTKVHQAEEQLKNLTAASKNLVRTAPDSPEKTAVNKALSTVPVEFRFDRQNSSISVYGTDNAQEDRAKARMEIILGRYSDDVDFHDSNDPRPANTTVYYFREGDEPGARVIANTLRSTLGFAKVSVGLHAKRFARDNQRFEIWLGAGDL